MGWLDRLIDRLQGALLWLLALVFVSGGYYERRFELSQVDVLAWPVLFLGLWRWKRTGQFLAEGPRRTARILAEVAAQRPRLTLAVLFVAHVLLYTWLHVWRYQSFNANGFDLGFILQGMWSTAFPAQGTGFLGSSLSRGGTYLGEHFAPILSTLAPGFRLFPSPVLLFIAHSTLIAGGAVLVYKLARQAELESAPSLFLAALFLLYQPVRQGNSFDLREDAFFVPVVLGMLLAVAQRRFWLLWVLAALCLGVKENGGLVVGSLAIWLMMTRRWFQGAALVAVAVVAFFVVNLKLMPFFAGGSATVAVSRFGVLGSTNEEIVSRLLGHPLTSLWALIIAKVGRGTFWYLLQVFLPFIPATIVLIRGRQKEAILFGFAGLFAAQNIVLSNAGLGFHYELVLVPFLFAGLIAGFGELIRRYGLANAGGLVLVLAFCVGGRGPLLSVRNNRPEPAHHCLEKALQAIPPKASVRVLNALQPHVAQRKVANGLFNLSNLTEDMLVVSTYPGIDRYGISDLEAELTKLDRTRYQPIVEGRIVSMWCRSDVCTQYAPLKQGLAGLACLN